MTSIFKWQRISLLLLSAVALAACSVGPQITTTQEVSASADTPYENILVVALFASFDVRKQFEKAVVKQLSESGTKAVASTSMMNSKTPMTRQTYLAMVETLGVDAVLVNQVGSLESKTSLKDASPEATYNIGSTYYYNVWSVELTEYVEPPSIEVKSSVVVATQLYAVVSQEPVWAIESKLNIVQDAGRPRHYPFIADEAKAIAAHMSKDGLIAQ